MSRYYWKECCYCASTVSLLVKDRPNFLSNICFKRFINLMAIPILGLFLHIWLFLNSHIVSLSIEVHSQAMSLKKNSVTPSTFVPVIWFFLDLLPNIIKCLSANDFIRMSKNFLDGVWIRYPLNCQACNQWFYKHSFFICKFTNALSCRFVKIKIHFTETKWKGRAENFTCSIVYIGSRRRRIFYRCI